MIVLGIDPGEALIGIGAISSEGSRIKLIGYECITTEKGAETADKLLDISEKIAAVLEKYKPDLVSIEDLFFFKNLKTAIKVAQARGVLMLACKQKGVSIVEFTPLQVKQAVACYGRADKKQVQKMVKAILGMKEIPKPDDAADALALAICAANTNPDLIKSKRPR